MAVEAVERDRSRRRARGGSKGQSHERVGDDERITTSVRTKMGKAALGSDAYEHIMIYFVKPLVGDGADAEKTFLKVGYLKMFGGTQETVMHSAVDERVRQHHRPVSIWTTRRARRLGGASV